MWCYGRPSEILLLQQKEVRWIFLRKPSKLLPRSVSTFTRTGEDELTSNSTPDTVEGTKESMGKLEVTYIDIPTNTTQDLLRYIFRSLHALEYMDDSKFPRDREMISEASSVY